MTESLIKMIVKVVVVIVITALPTTSTAGFITGFALGQSFNNGGKSTPGTVVAISSDHDTIMCYMLEGGCTRILGCVLPSGGPQIPPALYAGCLGYKTIHKIGVAIGPTGREYYIMEVSK